MATAMERAEMQRTELVLPAQANHYGTLFGPNAMALLGEAAFLAATQFCRQPVVMAAVERIDFLAPIPVGAILSINTCISRIGRSSMTVSVRGVVDAADVLRAEFAMVAVDANGCPIPLAGQAAKHAAAGV